jgi:hypothetical protein
MLQVMHTLANADRIASWLDSMVRPQLRADVSNYARGRLRCWLGVEPPLSSTQRERPGFDAGRKILDRLAELIEWEFDFCLVTYSGDDHGIGIGPHRDAAFADFEGRGVSLTGQCVFRHWADHTGLGRSHSGRSHTADDTPTTVLDMQPGQVIAFNVKDLHAAEPGPGRWGINFWRRK